LENPKAYHVQIRNEGSPPMMRLTYQFQGQKVKCQGHQAH